MRFKNCLALITSVPIVTYGYYWGHRLMLRHIPPNEEILLTTLHVKDENNNIKNGIYSDINDVIETHAKTNTLPFISNILVTPPIGDPNGSRLNSLQYFFSSPFGHSSNMYSFKTMKNVSELCGERKRFTGNNIELSTFVVNMSMKQCLPNPVHICSPDTYFFEADRTKSDQGGLYFRTMYEVRQYTTEENVKKMHNSFMSVYDDMTNGTKKFNLIGHLHLDPNKWNWLRIIGGMKKYECEEGNCCYWSSTVFKDIGMLNTISNWPAMLFFKLLFKNKNAIVIKYESSKHKSIADNVLSFPYLFKRQFRKLASYPDYIVKFRGNEIKIYHVVKINKKNE